MQSHIRSYITEVEGIFDYVHINNALKRVRISIEWDYGGTAMSFRYLANQLKLKLLESTSVSKIYTVATFLRNIKSGIYGNQSSNYFDIKMRRNFIYHYINQIDFPPE